MNRKQHKVARKRSELREQFRASVAATPLPDRAAPYATATAHHESLGEVQATLMLPAPANETSARVITGAQVLAEVGKVVKVTTAKGWPKREQPKASPWTTGKPGRALGDLLRMLESRRPFYDKGHASQVFASQWLAPLGAKPDVFGNWILRIGADSTVLWSSHVDTVHHKAGPQRISFNNDMLRLSRHAKAAGSDCLGADDTAGVWIMREMALAGVPGLYIWHDGEEKGGLGSGFISKHKPEVLAGITKAIAFDRRGTHSVITHQAWDRCCSDAFDKALGDALGMGHKLDDGGTFTDTANYVDLVGECTNLSAGYYYEHSEDECLDVPYLFTLRAAMIGLDAEALPVVRKPGEVDIDSYGGRYGAPYYGTKSHSAQHYTGATSYSGGKTPARGWYDWESSDESEDSRLMRELVKRNPDEIARLLESYGVDLDEAADYVYNAGGIIAPDMLGRSYGRDDS